MTVAIRPGVERPDWSVVTSAAARAALRERAQRRSGLMNAWAVALRPDQDLVWRRTLELFFALGRPPFVAEIGTDLGRKADEVLRLLRDLEERDVVGLDESASAIAYAYPLTAQRTEHRIKFTGSVLHALCAVDALGVGAMYGTDVTVESKCRGCGTEIIVRTAGQGTALADASPDGVMVWYDQAYDLKAATSCCPSIAFFCSSAHLRSWRNDAGAKRLGHELSLAQAFEIGQALFGPLLRAPMVQAGAAP